MSKKTTKRGGKAPAEPPIAEATTTAGVAAPVKRAGRPPAVAKKPRAPGRPGGKSADLRERLLDAAMACFVRQGIAATSLRDIAAEAGVTPAMLHYYYGDKAQLQEAMVGERLLPVAAAIQQRVEAAGDDIADTVAAFVNGITAAVVEHPWWPQLWVREVLCEGGALRDLLITRVAPGMTRTIVARFAAAQARGALNPDLDPRLLMTSLVGLTLFPAAGAPIWRSLLDADDLGLDDVRRHAIALLDRGLELGK